MASSASNEQWTVRQCYSTRSTRHARLTGGRQSSLAISVFLTAPACSSDIPLTRSVIYDEEAMADPQPNVLNLTSEMFPLSSTRIWSFITLSSVGRSYDSSQHVLSTGCMSAMLNVGAKTETHQAHRQVPFQHPHRACSCFRPEIVSFIPTCLSL